MRDLDKQDKRIQQILGSHGMDVSEEASLRYMDYLKKNINFPCQLTGIEDFPWEEYYVLGPGSKKEYEKLKKEQPSYTDVFNLVSFEDELDENNGILVNVQRLSDKKSFILPLDYLKSVDKKSKNYQLLDDYSVWHINY
ncbi:MAG: hypothetical protein HZA78_00530 [Candidatus Schekmanbacteria bacterium]|nr:hypothetical protein [Candidatus Schekmanbacteria bacterium]